MLYTTLGRIVLSVQRININGALIFNWSMPATPLNYYCLGKIETIKSGILSIRLMNRTMSHIAVRSVIQEERMQLSLRFPATLSSSGANIKQRVFNFDRLKSEEVDKTLSRISASVSKISSKVAKKRAKSLDTNISGTPNDVRVILFRHFDNLLLPVDPSATNETAWEDGMTLEIGDEKYTVMLNLPTIKHVSLPDVVMSGFTVRPTLVTEFADYSKSQITWYKRKVDKCQKLIELPANKDSEDKPDATKSGGDNEDGLNSFDLATQSSSVVSALNTESDIDTDCLSSKNPVAQVQKKRKTSSAARSNFSSSPWVRVHCGNCYVPTDDDVGCVLKIDCIPSDGLRVGEKRTAESKFNVMACLGPYPFEKRHRYTEHLTNVGRFVTYNILADVYADSDFSRDYLFPYCPAYALNIDYRKLLIARELQGYNADIICLQEVDKKVFELDLSPSLAEAGFSCLLKLKSGDVSEGSATFFRQSKFRLINSHDLDLTDALFNDVMFKDIIDRVNTSAELLNKLKERTSCLQVTILQSKEYSSRYLLVATVHLYFHPKATHIRIIHTAVALRHIERILNLYSEQGIQPVVVFCGDLNSKPLSGVNEFLTTKLIKGKHADWYSGGKPEFVEGMNLTHNLELASALSDSDVRYTNYVTAFNECLDYIYTQPARLRATQVVPLPSHEDVTENTALPSIMFPSDHIALVCDFDWL